MFSVAGKTAIVTGASRGIGRTIAQNFARSGATVIICGLEECLGNTVTATIDSAEGSAYDSRAAITNAEAAHRHCESAGAATGRIDILCNNTSYTSGAQHESRLIHSERCRSLLQ